MYLTYDITSELQKGENEIAILVGNGWYNTHTRRWPASFGTPRMLCQIKVTYYDGTEEIIVSDQTWEVKKSAIVYNDEYAGEIYDAREENNEWQPAVPREAPAGKLCASYAPLDKVIETLRPESFTKTEKGWEAD